MMKVRPLIVALVFLLPAVVWVAVDDHCWEWDQARYAHMSFDLWQYLRSDPGLWWWTSFYHLPTKAPGISWMGQWFVYLKPLVGSVDHALMVQPMFCTLISSLLFFKVARRLAPESRIAPWIALALPYSNPLFANVHQEYMTEPVQMLGISWVLWLTIFQKDLRFVTVLANGFGALGFCMMAKGVTAMYIWGFGLCLIVACVIRIAKEKKDCLRAPVLSWVALVPALGFFALACYWYVLNLKHVLGYVVSASSGAIASAYGVERSYLEKTEVWLGFLYQSYATVPVLFALIATLLAAVFCQKQKVNWPLTALAFLQIAGVWIIVTTSTTEEWRPLLGLMPSILILLCVLLNRLKDHLTAKILLIALISQWGMIHAAAFGVNLPNSLRLWQAQRTPEPDSEKKQELFRIIRATCDQCPTMEHPMMCAVSVPWLNGNTLKYYAATEVTDTPRYGYYGSTGFLTTNHEKLVERFAEQAPCVVISMDLDEQLTYLSGSPAGQDFISFIEQHPDYEPMPFESAFGVRLFSERKSIP